jgi:hypothetical protein
MEAALRQQRIDRGQWKVRSVYHACLSFAREHDATGPGKVGELDAEEHRYILENLQTTPWWDWDEATDGERPDGPFVFLVPSARFHFADSDRQVVPGQRRELLAVELRPYVADGQHWVLYTDGTCVREPIDQQRIERYQLEIRPVVQVIDDSIHVAQATLDYTLVAVRSSAVAEPFEVSVFNSISGDEQKWTWTPGRSTAGPKGPRFITSGPRLRVATLSADRSGACAPQLVGVARRGGRPATARSGRESHGVLVAGRPCGDRGDLADAEPASGGTVGIGHGRHRDAAGRRSPIPSFPADVGRPAGRPIDFGRRRAAGPILRVFCQARFDRAFPGSREQDSWPRPALDGQETGWTTIFRNVICSGWASPARGSKPCCSPESCKIWPLSCPICC